ncbi:MAG: rod shape-determining protein [Limisphaerales bacterium]
MRSTYVPAPNAEIPKEPARKPQPSPFADLATSPDLDDILLVGFDFGTNASCLRASFAGSTDLVVNEIVPTVVGYAKEGIVENLLPGNAQVLFGQLAVKNRMFLRMVTPMVDGVVEDMAAAQEFARYLRSLINVAGDVELRAVVGLPAGADRSARGSLCQSLTGIFDKVILIPEPFLAALGFRDESRLTDPAYVDPVRNSLFVDIGAGTTDVCLVQGYFPTGDDQVSVPFAGDKVDMLVQESIRRSYPDVQLSLARVRELKEQFAFVGEGAEAVTVNAVVGGKMRKLELREAIGTACEQLLLQVFECVKTVIAGASSDTVADLLQNIVLTGGGSRIRNFDVELQRLLEQDGYERPRVQKVGENHKELVAQGALVAGRQAKEAQWLDLPG